MADLEQRLARARERVVPVWTPDRERTVRARVEVRLELRQRRRVVALSFALLALVVGGLFAWPRFSSRGALAIAPHASSRVSTPPLPLPAPVSDLLHFEDGSAVAALTAEARAEPVEVGPTAITVRLDSGAARFSVTPNAARIFRVLARDTTVTVLGTVFTVAIEPDGVKVTVERGRVHVEWPAGERILGVGEQVITGGDGLRPEGHLEIGVTSPTPDASPSDRAAVRSTGTPPTSPSWRSFAEEGDYNRAFARLSADGAAAIRDEPGDLLLAADVARLGGHPEKAMAPLERVLGAHASDSRAPLAAFTLGRTLLDQLGRPSEAALAFARARKLDSGGALAQDALAREVESWGRAGDARTARERAEEYVALYPKGRRLQAVRRLGGLP